MEPTDRFGLSLPSGRPFEVVGFGLNAVDHLHVVSRFPPPGGKVRIESSSVQCGGQVATAMVTLRRLGVRRVRYVGKVGSDPAGHASLASIRGAGVDTHHVTVEPGATNQYAVILVDRTSGERTIAWHRDPRLLYRPGELRREWILGGRVLHLDGHDVAASLLAAHWAREEGIPVTLDIDTVRDGTERLIREVDFVVSSEEFPGRLTGHADLERALRGLRRATPAFLCATRGSRGAVALLGDRLYEAPGFEVRAVDTTGAGDVFHGAFLYGLLEDWPVGRILRFANAAAALSCRAPGARAGIPERAEVLALAGP